MPCRYAVRLGEAGDPEDDMSDMPIMAEMCHGRLWPVQGGCPRWCRPALFWLLPGQLSHPHLAQGKGSQQMNRILSIAALVVVVTGLGAGVAHASPAANGSSITASATGHVYWPDKHKP